MNEPMPDRNNTIGFCNRVRRNLEFIETTKNNDPDAPVHAVTQLVLSLLGIVVFPYERAPKIVFAKPITEMRREGWFGWSITRDEPPPKKCCTETLGDLLWHLRNAVAHNRLRFDSDDPDLNFVKLTFEDRPRESAPVNWCAEINASELKTFCLEFTRYVDQVLG